MDEKIKRIDITEFRKLGYLQEVNRQFFHPLGLALEIVINDDGSEKLGGIWDYRDDPEGILYGDTPDKDKAEFIMIKMTEKLHYRVKKFGWALQPTISYTEKIIKESANG